MTNPLSLDSILQSLGEDATTSTKTASETAPARTAPNLEADMLATVQAFTQKTAAANVTAVAEGSAGDAVGALRKIAADTASAEDLATVKTAQLAGAAMCDGFMARLAGYDADVTSKTASAQPANAQGGYTEEHLKLAYEKGIEDFQKQAAADYEEGQRDALVATHKIASEYHGYGQASARNVLLALSTAGDPA